jgi:hypothetical protein
MATDSVARLVEFLPIGSVFIFGSFMKIREIAHILVFHSKSLATFWAIFFTNSIGHPGHGLSHSSHVAKTSLHLKCAKATCIHRDSNQLFHFVDVHMTDLIVFLLQ